MGSIDVGSVENLREEIKALANEIRTLKDVKGNEDLVLIKLAYFFQ